MSTIKTFKEVSDRLLPIFLVSRCGVVVLSIVAHCPKLFFLCLEPVSSLPQFHISRFLQFQFLEFLPQGESGLLGFSLWSRPALAFGLSPNPAGRSPGCTLQGLRTEHNRTPN